MIKRFHLAIIVGILLCLGGLLVPFGGSDNGGYEPHKLGGHESGDITPPFVAPGFSCTTTLSAGANVGASVEAAASGATICLNTGTYAQIKVAAAKPAAPVTVRAVEGATPSVAGIWIHGQHGSAARENLVFRNLNMSAPVLIEENAKHLRIEYNKFGMATTGSTTLGSNIVTGIPNTAGMFAGEAIYAANISNKEDTSGGTNTAEVTAILNEHELEIGPSSASGEKEGATFVARPTSTASNEGIFVGPVQGVYMSNTINESQSDISTEYNTFTALGPCLRPSISGGVEKTQNCSVNGRGTCYKSVAATEETTFNHNVCGPYSPTHYTQPPCEKLKMNYNLFMGPAPYPVGGNSGGEHQNPIQCLGPKNTEIAGNIFWKTQDIITVIFEGVGTTKYSAGSDVISNNLVVGGHSADAFQIGPLNGFTFTNNTTVGGFNEVTRFPGFNEETNQGKEGENYTLEHNIFVKRGSVDPGWGSETAIGYLGVCKAGSVCNIGNNAAEDSSMEGQPGGLKCPTPEWEGTTWNPMKEREEGLTPKAPIGYYIVKAGTCLAGAQGYIGGGGP